MRAVKSVSIDSARRVIITYLDGSTETLYPNCIWCDSEALRELIKDLLEEKADAITQTIENVTVASFADGADEGLIKKLLVSIEPIQEGTGDPSPENVRPISGRTGLSVVRSGRNLIPTIFDGDVTKNGITFEVKSDGIHATGTATSNTYYNIVLRNNQSPILPAGTYTLSPTGAQQDNVDIRVAEVAGQAIIAVAKTSKTTFTITESKQYFCFFYIPNGTIFNDAVLTPQIEVGSTATDYEPYKRNTYSVNWETEAGTVYGGTLDIVSGKLTVDMAMVDLGSLRWGYESAWVAFVSALPDAKRVNSSQDANWVSSIFHLKSSHFSGSQSPDLSVDCNSNAHGVGTLTIKDTEYGSDAAAFKTAMSGVQFVYELAAPLTYQLTPQEVTTLLGTNNIWAGSGNILELEYTADTKLYIGEQQSVSSGTLGMVNRPTVVDKQIEPVGEITDTDSEVTE